MLHIIESPCFVIYFQIPAVTPISISIAYAGIFKKLFEILKALIVEG